MELRRSVFDVWYALVALAFMAAQFAGGEQGEGASDIQTPPVREGVSDFTEEQLVRVTEMIGRAMSAVATSDLSSDVRMRRPSGVLPTAPSAT